MNHSFAKYPLKSSLDRFIDHPLQPYVANLCDLKSSLDRFIVLSWCYCKY